MSASQLNTVFFTHTMLATGISYALSLGRMWPLVAIAVQIAVGIAIILDAVPTKRRK